MSQGRLIVPCGQAGRQRDRSKGQEGVDVNVAVVPLLSRICVFVYMCVFLH